MLNPCSNQGGAWQISRTLDAEANDEVPAPAEEPLELEEVAQTVESQWHNALANPKSRLSLYASAGVNIMPGDLYLKLAGGQDHSPTVLVGDREDIGAKFAFTKKGDWRFGLGLFHSKVSGRGPFGSNSDWEKYGAKGQEIGTLNLDAFGGYLILEKIFFFDSSWTPHVELDAGVESLRAKFRGKFYGTYVPLGITIKGFPAADNEYRIEPFFDLNIGVYRELKFGFVLDSTISINTLGITPKIQIEKDFD